MCSFLKYFILINNQLLSTANAKDINTDYYCADFRNESNRIFVLGVVFSSDKFRLFNQPFWPDFLNITQKVFVALSSSLERYFTCDPFCKVMGV